MEWKAFVQKLETRRPEGLSVAEMQVANEDLMPVPPEKRTWTWWNFVSFWIADGFNLGTFTMTSTLIVSGLNVWQALICVVIGYTLVGPYVVLTCRPGAVFNIKFPAVCRTSFGIFGSYWPIINRVAIACIWSGVQAWLGGECVHVFLRTMWRNIDDDIPNTMPASSQTQSSYIMCYVIYWLLMLPTIWVPLHQLRHLFLVKSIVGPIVGFALFGWSIRRAGANNVFSTMQTHATLEGSDLTWQMLRGIAIAFNNLFPLIVNSPDFASTAKNPAAAMLPQLITIPCVFVITSFIGIVIGQSAQVQFNEKLWDIVAIMNRMLDPDQNPTAATRAGLWFISAGFVYVQLLTNVAANSLAAGCDLTALCPRFINIRRGGYVSALVAIVMNPWLLYKSSTSFLNYLSSFSVLLSCIAGPMAADYFLVRRGHYRITDLYSLSKEGWYWYTIGINWRAYVAYFAGFAINAPGFISTCSDGRINVSTGWKHVFDLAWITGTFTSAIVYVLCSYAFPPPGVNFRFKEVDESDFSVKFVGAYNYGISGEAYENMHTPAPEVDDKDKGDITPTEFKPVVTLEDYKY
ncbi:hypothetical protein MCUN1_003453 [Malassezia cuniculi]|uniref:Uracil permease n=1 Tax=Malassezia cuniculi TaxID=948313 RepID=A0AAF0J7Z9_9BASI|nr:hypothetical protein MCUN1_003453 [Malassezia cuniculi]